jgi:hypothetical protein
MNNRLKAEKFYEKSSENFLAKVCWNAVIENVE